MAFELTATQQKYADNTINKITQLKQKQDLSLPAHYDAASAVQSALFKMNEIDAFNKATNDSIQEALLNMVVQGLEPQKTQAYFIMYGSKVQMQRSYFGTQAVLKRLPEIEDVLAYVVHEGETFEVDYDDSGNLAVTAHKTDFNKLDNEIIGAYAKIIMTDGTVRFEVMTKKQIDQSWAQSRNGTVQKKFPAEMAKRTVINRAAKNIINTSTGNGTLIEAINDTTSNEYENDDRRDITPAQSESKEKAVELLNKFADVPDADLPNPFENAEKANQDVETEVQPQQEKQAAPVEVEANQVEDVDAFIDGFFQESEVG